MHGFVIILVALNIGVPVRCYQDVPAWNQIQVEVEARGSIAFYVPDEYIALSPRQCRQVRKATYEGAHTLAHEIGHRKDDLDGTPLTYIKALDEARAEQYAFSHVLSLQKRLAKLFKVKLPKTVTLAPDKP